MVATSVLLHTNMNFKYFQVDHFNLQVSVIKQDGIPSFSHFIYIICWFQIDFARDDDKIELMKAYAPNNPLVPDLTLAPER